MFDVFQDSKELLKHVFQTHHVSTQPPCQHQNETVINKDTNENDVRIQTEPLDFNESQNEDGNVQCNCEKCKKTFYDKGTLKKHIRSVHEKVRHTCEVCGKTFSQKGHLRGHIQSVHENVRYNCDKCDKSFSLKQLLTLHIKSVHENRYNCDECGKNFSSKSSLNRHIQKVHKDVKNIHEIEK